MESSSSKEQARQARLAASEGMDWGAAADSPAPTPTALPTPAKLTAVPQSTRGGARRIYLVIFEPESSSMFPLPLDGEVVIGRGKGAALSLRDPAVSRSHAKIVLRSGEAQVHDLGSQNGTSLNGERVTEPAPLASGDVLTLCDTTLVFHSSARYTTSRRFLAFEEFRQRMEEEIERSLRYSRRFTLFAVAVGPCDRSQVAQTLTKNLRFMDIPSWGGPDQLLVLFPEVGSERADVSARRLLERLSPVCPQARVGFATFPSDGIETDTLLNSARAAAQVAAAGTTSGAGAAYRTLELDGHPILVADTAMNKLYALLERLAACELPILIWGETGTGKELAARALHTWSARRNRPLVTVNCAAIHENLLESELFGHEKGAFSGAVGAKPGLLESADGGTVFLDEIGELPAQAQAKVLRVLETKRVTRLGDVREREIDIRLVAATNRNLDVEVKENRFRKDLYFRLSGARVWIPPLRDRGREIPLLAQSLLVEACRRANRPAMVLADSARQILTRYNWPGNVRQLKNAMEYAVATLSEPVLDADALSQCLGGTMADTLPVGETQELAVRPRPTEFNDDDTVIRHRARKPGEGGGETGGGAEARLPRELATAPRRLGQARDPDTFRPLEEEVRALERTRILEALATAEGNQTRAAALIGMPRRTFVAKLREYKVGQSSEGRRSG